MSAKKIYIVVEAVKEKTYRQNFPEITDVILHGAFTSKKAAEAEKSKYNAFNTRIKETTLEV